jgi:DNA-directed RNA polymerase specialized sigma24 family protein
MSERCSTSSIIKRPIIRANLSDHGEIGSRELGPLQRRIQGNTRMTGWSIVPPDSILVPVDRTDSSFVRHAKEFKMKNETVPMNISASEAELAHLAQQGHLGAFVALFDSHKTTVYSLCQQSTLSAPDAEQLTQDIFLDAFRNLAACPKCELDDASFLGRLHSSAVNRIQIYERKARLSAPFLDHLVKLAVVPVERHRAPLAGKRAHSRNNRNNNEESGQSPWPSWSSVFAKFVRPRQPVKAIS